MNMPGLATGGMLLAALLVWMLASAEREDVSVVPAPQASEPRSQRVAVGAEGINARPGQDEPAVTDDWFAPPPLPTSTDAGLNGDAIASLRSTRKGDPRAPAIGKGPERIRPDAATLANPERYQDWQRATREARYAGYLKAADQRLQEIDQQLAWGRDNGVPHHALAEGQEKRQRLKSARDTLAGDYPHLVPAETPAPQWQPPTRATE